MGGARRRIMGDPGLEPGTSSLPMRIELSDAIAVGLDVGLERLERDEAAYLLERALKTHAEDAPS